VLCRTSIAERADIPQTHLSDIQREFKLPNLLTVVSARDRAGLQSRRSHVGSRTADLPSLIPK
jgi:hypothetical protein